MSVDVILPIVFLLLLQVAQFLYVRMALKRGVLPVTPPDQLPSVNIQPQTGEVIKSSDELPPLPIKQPDVQKFAITQIIRTAPVEKVDVPVLRENGTNKWTLDVDANHSYTTTVEWSDGSRDVIINSVPTKTTFIKSKDVHPVHVIDIGQNANATSIQWELNGFHWA